MCKCSRNVIILLLSFVASAELMWAGGEKKMTDAPPKVTRIPDSLRKKHKLDPWYKKCTDYKGFSILSSGKVSDAALLEARYIISQMLAERDDLLKAMIRRRARVTVMAPTEMTTDVPEQRNMKPKAYWDRRARGLGGRITSCGEENLLNLRGDRYRNENILVHEFSHCIHSQGLRSVDRKFDRRLRATYARAMDKGLWKKTYAATNAGEYWAEGVQSYFDCNAPRGGVHNHVNTREELAKYDPDLFKLIDEVFKQSKWRYVRYDRRKKRRAEGRVFPARRAEGLVPSALIAHWKLTADAKDHSGNSNHGKNHRVNFRGGSAAFDGRGAHITVPPSKSLRKGTGEFSISVWVNTAEALDDALGDIVSQYDPAKRRGFQLGIMNYAGVTSSQANYRNVHFGIDNGKSESKWTDHGRMGKAVMIFAMAVYKDQLFVGTCEAGKTEAGRVFRFDGNKWFDCGAPDRCNSISSLAVYRGQLYAGSSKYRLRGSSLPESENPHLGGNIYRYESDGKWIPCGELPNTEAIGGLVVYRDKLYAGSLYRPAGFFRYEGGTKWTSCGTAGGKRVESFTVFNGHIYATGYDEGAVYRYDGKNWIRLGRVGEANQTYGFATYEGNLYVSEWPNAKVYRYGGKKNWVFAGKLGQELETMPLMVYNGKMYAGTLPSAQIYRFDGGEMWTKIARLDFTPKVRYRRVWCMAIYKGRLFAGTLPSGHVHSIEIGKNVTYDTELKPGWRHIAAVKGKDCLQLYVDGKLAATSTTFKSTDYNLSSEQPLKIGIGAHDYYNGRMRDLRIYRRALDAGDVKTIAATIP